MRTTRTHGLPSYRHACMIAETAPSTLQRAIGRASCVELAARAFATAYYFCLYTRFYSPQRVCGVMSASCVHVTVCACVRATTNRTAFVGTRNGMHTHTHMMEKLANETAIIALTIIDATYSIVRFRSARVPFCIHAERQIKTCLFRQPRPLFAHERSPNYRFSYAP